MKQRSMRLFVVLATLLHVPFAQAQVQRPAPPAKYHVDVRYRIDLIKLERVRAFFAMRNFFEKLGFVRDPADAQKGKEIKEELNPAADRVSGVMPSDNVGKLFQNRHVRMVQIIPVNAPPRPIERIELSLSTELGPGAQRELYDTLLSILQAPPLGYKDGVAYVREDYTRLVGKLPSTNLIKIFNDVRLTPPAWTLLSPTLLTDLRRVPGGQDDVKNLLLEWNNDKPEGNAIIKAVVQDWQAREPSAKKKADELPAAIRRRGFEDVLQEIMLKHLADHVNAEPYLADLLKRVFASPKGPVLMTRLLPLLTQRQFHPVVPPLYRLLSPIRIMEVRPDWPLPIEREPIVVPAQQRKLSPQVRDLLRDAVRRDQPQRFELILDYVPAIGNRTWQRPFIRALPSIVVEGIAGPFATIVCKPSEITVLAEQAVVSAIRLPRSARSCVIQLPQAEGDAQTVLQKTGLAQLHRQQKLGQGVRVAVIDSDFRGWDGLLGKGLPQDTRFVDMSLDRTPNLMPDPYPGPAQELGGGTVIARAVHLAAPRAQINLIRVDPTSSFQAFYALQQILGTPVTPETRRARREELLVAELALDAVEKELVERRADVLSQFPDNRELGRDGDKVRPAHGKADVQKLLAAKKYFEDLQAFEQQRDALQVRRQRLIDYVNRVNALSGIDVVVSNLSWASGQAVDNSAFLSRYFDEERPDKVTWIQAVGNVENQVWVDLFRDADRDGIMEHADARSKLPQKSWTHELSFLAWQPWEGMKATRLPAGTRARATIQWHEAHDPRYARPGYDTYRRPLADFKLLALQQFDPDGKNQPADDFAIVAESSGLAQRVQRSRNGATFEHSIVFDVADASRIALVVEGSPPVSTQPKTSAVFPQSTRFGETKPRIVVETLSGQGGHAVFDAYSRDEGEITMPADSTRVIAVGAGTLLGKNRSYSARGPLYNVTLKNKPDVVFPDRLGISGSEKMGGSGIAAGLAAGHAAVLRGAGHKRKETYSLLRTAAMRLK